MIENSDLRNLYIKFNNELLGIQRGSLDIRKTKDPLIKLLKKGPKLISESDIKKAIEKHLQLNTARDLTFNGSFLYSFSIFERFLTSLSKYLIKKDRNIKKRYEDKFLDFMAHQIDTAKNKSETKSTLVRMQSKNKLDFYDDIEAKEKVFGLSKYLFQVREDDNYYQYVKFRFIEARLRRNLIAHRGTGIDDKYKKLLKEQTSPKLYKKYIEGVYRKENLVSVINNEKNDTKSKRFVDQKQNDPENLSITPNYLRQTTLNLLYIGAIFYLNAVKKVNDSKIMVPLAEASLEFKNTHYVRVSSQISKYIFEHINDGNLSKVHDISKMNYLTSLKYLIDKNSKNNNVEEYLQDLDKYKKPILESFSDKRFLGLTEGYLEKNIATVISSLNDILENGLTTKDDLKKLNKKRKKKIPQSYVRESGIDFLKRNSGSFYFMSMGFIKNNKELKDFFNKKELKMNRQIKISRKSKND